MLYTQQKTAKYVFTEGIPKENNTERNQAFNPTAWFCECFGASP